MQKPIGNSPATTPGSSSSTSTRQFRRFGPLVEPGYQYTETGAVEWKGVPYGPTARLMLLYMQTEALRTRSPEVRLGRCMSDFLASVGIAKSGRAYQAVREQCTRLSACRLTVRCENASGSSGFKRANIVGGLVFSPPGDNRQGRLWEETATLSLEFYNALVSHPVPVSLAAMKSLAGNSSAMDVYVWLSYRLRSLSKLLLISWDELQPQFGFAYSSTKKFRERFLDTLKTALAVYDGACVEAGRSGLTLYPSPPPIAERPPALPRPQSA